MPPAVATGAQVISYALLVLALVAIVAAPVVLARGAQPSRHARTLANIARLERELGISAPDPGRHAEGVGNPTNGGTYQPLSPRAGDSGRVPQPLQQTNANLLGILPVYLTHAAGADQKTIKANRKWRMRAARYAQGRRDSEGRGS